MRSAAQAISPCVAFLLLAAAGLPAAELRLLFPLERTAYATSERIDLSAVRADPAGLPAADLSLALAGDDGSRLEFVFPLPAVPAAAGGRSVEHLGIDGRLLRPGGYTVTASAHGARAEARLEVFGHIRKSPFRTIDWGSRAQGADLAKLGEEGLGFNLIYGDYRLDKKPRNGEATLRGGAESMQCCTMSGGHQMDLRQECDWSDPLVVRGATARAVQQAFIDRTQPNAIGVHFYDEPGLTWGKDPESGKFTPHAVPAQLRSFRSAFGAERPRYSAVRADDPATVEAWMEWGRWKESFMDAAWKDARWGVELASPGAISVTQSMYAFEAYTDGHYFNVARSLPVLSGHGGYDDGPASYFYPSYHFEFGRMRELEKPSWYLPMWYAGMASEVFRLEQYLTFQCGVQGLAKPPDHTVHDPASTSSAEGIVESNRLLAALGPIFAAMPPARGEVAILYSLSQCLDAQVRSGMEDNYLGGKHTRARLLSAYLASKQIHIPFQPIVEEDVLDGTLAARHRAVLLAGIDFLAPEVVAALEAYAAAGGLVLLTADCKVAVPKAEKLAAEADASQYEKIEELWKTDQKESFRQRRAERFLEVSAPLARALAARLGAAGIRPAVDCDSPAVVVTRQAWGDLEYIFAVNATPAPEGGPLWIRAATATLTFPGDGRPVYDAVRGGPVPELEAAPAAPGSPRKAAVRFGPGGMRIFLRPVRPLGGVRVGTPVVSADFTRRGAPVEVTFAANLVDDRGTALAGAAPLEVRLLDPLGGVRYDLYRATGLGGATISLPLAANDPPGSWTVEATDLIGGGKGTAAFEYRPARTCAALAGATRRAVSFGSDREAIFGFFRRCPEVTIVRGSGAAAAGAAARLAEILRPWGVRSTVVDAAAVDRPRELTADEAPTWVGLEFGRAEPGAKTTPYKTGFALERPAVLVGSPADNPLIAAVEKWGFLPYRTGPDFPGPRRGYIAWQRDAVGIGLESITVIGFDDKGLSEAVGTVYEAAAGLDPLLPLVPPRVASVAPATRTAPPAPPAAIAWTAVLPDRALALEPADGGALEALGLDESRTTIEASGRIRGSRPAERAAVDAAWKASAKSPEAPAALKPKLLPAKILKRVAAGEAGTALGYWGGTLQVFRGEALVAQQYLPQDISALAWLGPRLVVALSDGRVLGLDPK